MQGPSTYCRAVTLVELLIVMMLFTMLACVIERHFAQQIYFLFTENKKLIDQSQLSLARALLQAPFLAHPATVTIHSSGIDNGFPNHQLRFIYQDESQNIPAIIKLYIKKTAFSDKNQLVYGLFKNTTEHENDQELLEHMNGLSCQFLAENLLSCKLFLAKHHLANNKSKHITPEFWFAWPSV